MQVISDLFNLVLFGPMVNALVLIVRTLEATNLPGALAFSIIILTVLIRLLVWPFMATQLKSAKKMADLKPHLDGLKKKHGDNKQALAQAQLALYKEHGVNPAGGCLPALIQIPIIIALYQVILALFDGGAGLARINQVLYATSWHLTSAPDPYFLGFNLGDRPADFLRIGPLVLLIPVITALLTFLQSKMMMPVAPKIYPSDSPKEVKEKSDTEEAMTAVQSQMAYLMPIMIGYIAFTFQIGLAIYWNTFTLLGIWQQHRISGWGGLEDLVRSIKQRVIV